MTYTHRRLDQPHLNVRKSTLLRDHVLHLIREERASQLRKHGGNSDLNLGFGGNVSSYPWLRPYSKASATAIQERFRADYEAYESENGKPTWMHLIREEVAELFETRTIEDAVDEAIQVAALCVSLVEHLFSTHEGERQ